MSEDIIHCDDCPTPCEEKVMYSYSDTGSKWCRQNSDIPDWEDIMRQVKEKVERRKKMLRTKGRAQFKSKGRRI